MARGKLGQTGFRTWLRTSAYTIQQVTHFLPGVVWLWCCTCRTLCWACTVSNTMDFAAHQKRSWSPQYFWVLSGCTCVLVQLHAVTHNAHNIKVCTGTLKLQHVVICMHAADTIMIHMTLEAKARFTGHAMLTDKVLFTGKTALSSIYYCHWLPQRDLLVQHILLSLIEGLSARIDMCSVSLVTWLSKLWLECCCAAGIEQGRGRGEWIVARAR